MRSALSLALLVAMTTPTVTSASVTLPDVRTGNVNGKVGLLYWPANPTPIGAEAQPLPSAEHCEVHMVPGDDRDRELRYPCGSWFAPPVGRYYYWLEMPGRITPRQSIAVYAASPFRGAGLGAVIPVAPAGVLSLPRDRSLGSHESLRLISTSVRYAVERNAAVFDRQVPAKQAHEPVQMPEGTAIVGRFDAKSGDAIALSRPIALRPDRAVTVWPEAPTTSDVLVILNKPPELQGNEEPHQVTMTLDDATRVRSPDVLVKARNVLVAVWYAVDARRATIALQSNALFWPGQEVRLLRGKVTTVRSAVTSLPNAKVSIHGPPGARLPDPLLLEITRNRSAIRTIPLNAGLHEIADLPAELLEFTLRVGDWAQSKVVDLTPGDDALVAFDLEPLTITGTVYHGDAPARGRIEFHNGENSPAVETDGQGRYETTLWWPDVYTARVTIDGANQPPFLDAFREIFSSSRVDFHVPRTDYRVRVIDAATRRGIPGVRVTAGSVATDGTRQSAQRVSTDDDGLAVLPPLLGGELIIDAHHDRYAPIEPSRMPVDGESHQLEIVLQQLSIGGVLRVVLPNGAPAAQAEVWALDAAMNAIWRGTSASDGSLAIPDHAADVRLLVRHPNAATTIRRWSENETTWTLDPAAEPLTITASAGAYVVLWLDGVRLSGAPLTVATWSAPMTNHAGLWTGRNLPPRSVRMLTLAPDAAMNSGHDVLAREIPYPWPSGLHPSD